MAALKRVVDVAEPVPQDVAEPDEQRKIDAARLQVVGELLEIDRLARVLRRVHEHLAGVADREVALAPPVDLVQLGGVGGTPLFVRAHRRPQSSGHCAHGRHDKG